MVACRKMRSSPESVKKYSFYRARWEYDLIAGGGENNQRMRQHI